MCIWYLMDIPSGMQQATVSNKQTCLPNKWCEASTTYEYEQLRNRLTPTPSHYFLIFLSDVFISLQKLILTLLIMRHLPKPYECGENTTDFNNYTYKMFLAGLV